MSTVKHKKVRRILVLGGYGNFGKRIAENLSAINEITVIIAGRNSAKAERLCKDLDSNGVNTALETAVLDINSRSLVDELKSLRPDLVIHTSGPFQGQNYRVPEACIAADSHYIDLADDRRFVCDITSLDGQAQAQGLLLVSGASSVPGLSSTVIDKLADEFSELEDIDFAIAPGNQAERGAATVHGILSYTGHPFSVFNKGKWVNRYGWMDPRQLDFGATIGKRWLANVDIPDLELFPQRYDGVKSVKFQAGLELPILHFGMVFMASLAKMGIIKNWAKLTSPIVRTSELFTRFGTATGGMQINLSGRGKNQQPKHLKWTLCAENGVGPYIPTISTIILAKKLIAGDIVTRGAMPCLGLYSLDDFDREARPLGIFHKVEG